MNIKNFRFKIPIPKKSVVIRLLQGIMIISLICVIILMTPRNQIKLRINRINKPDTMSSKMPIPEYLNYIVSVYTGELNTQIIAKTYYNLATVEIPEFYKKCSKLDDSMLEKYFEKHKELIEIELGFTDYKEFKGFIDIIRELKGEKLEFEDYRILEGTVEKKGNTVYACLIIKYKSNEEIAINTQLLYSVQKGKTSILFSTPDKQKLERAKEEYQKQEEELKNYKSPYTRGSPIK